MERNLDVVNELLTAFRDAMQNDWVVCVVCLAAGFAIIIGYKIWER